MRAPLVTLVRANARASWRKYALTGAAVGISAFFLAMVILLSRAFKAAFVAHDEDRGSRSVATNTVNVAKSQQRLRHSDH